MENEEEEMSNHQYEINASMPSNQNFNYIDNSMLNADGTLKNL